MSPVNQLSVLAFAAGALAVPQWGERHGHNHHNKFHGHGAPSASGSGVPFPFPVENATSMYGTTGIGFATGTSAPSYTGPVVSVETETSIETYGNAASSDCTTDVTVTTTERTYVTVTEDVTLTSSSSVEVSATEGSSSRGTSTVTIQSTVYASSSAASAAPSYSAGNSSSVAAYTASAPTSAEVSPVTSSESSYVAPVTYSAQNKHHPWSKWGGYQSSAYSTSSSVESSSAAAPSSYEAPSTSSVYVAPTTSSTSEYVAPTTSSVYVAPTTSSTSVYVAPTTSSSTASSAAATSSASTSTRGKRGLAYNDASLTSCFMEAPAVGWAYNWGSGASGFDTTTGVNYVPLLWGTSDDFTGSWNDNAAAAIKAGSEYLFSFNEPDLSTQANLSPEDAAAAYKQYMEPFAGQAKLCAPAVTNGGGSMGLTWLSNFMDACSDCTIDCVSIHWYDSYSNADYFKSQVTNATSVSGGKPVFVSEFGSTDGSDDDVSGFLQDVMPWLDSNDDVAGYSYFMVSDGLLVSGTEMSPYGSTYANYS